MNKKVLSILADKRRYQLAKNIYIIRYSGGEIHFINKRKAVKFRNNMPKYIKTELIKV